MERFASNTLWLTAIALPALLFLAGNRFRSPRTTIVRALLAILLGWPVVLAYAIAAQALASDDPSEVRGAPLAFASVFGWVVPALVVGITGLVVAVVRRVKPNNR